MESRVCKSQVLLLPVNRDGDGHVDGCSHEGVGGRVEEGHEEWICSAHVDLKWQVGSEGGNGKTAPCTLSILTYSFTALLLLLEP